MVPEGEHAMSDRVNCELAWRWQQFWAYVGVPWLLVSLIGLGHHLNPYNPHAGDLLQDWLSARCYFVGQPVYSPMDETVPQFLGVPNSQAADSLRVNAHPPTSVLPVLPLALLSYPQAKLVWNLLSLASVAVAIGCFFHPRGLALDRSYIWPVTLLIVCSGPLASQTMNAQFNAVLLMLLSTAWLAQRNGWSYAAGALIGFAASIKLFPLYFLLVFFVLRDWRAIAGLVGSLAVMVVLTGMVFGWETWRVYLVDVMPTVGGWRGSWLNASLTGFWARLFDPANPGVAPLVYAPLAAKVATLASVALLSLGVAIKGWRAQSVRERDLAFAAGVVVMLLASPTVWDHYWVMLLLPLGIYWFSAEISPWRRVLFWSAVVLLGVVRPKWIWDVLIVPFAEVATPLHSVLVLAYPTYCLLIVAGVLLASRPREEEAHAASREAVIDRRLAIRAS